MPPSMWSRSPRLLPSTVFQPLAGAAAHNQGKFMPQSMWSRSCQRLKYIRRQSSGGAAPADIEYSPVPNMQIAGATPTSKLQPFNDKPIDDCIANIRCEGNWIHKASSQTQPQNLIESKVIFCVCKERFPTKNEFMDHSDHPSKKKCNQHDCQK